MSVLCQASIVKLPKLLKRKEKMREKQSMVSKKNFFLAETTTNFLVLTFVNWNELYTVYFCFVYRLKRNAISFFALRLEKANHGWSIMKVRRNFVTKILQNVSYTSTAVLTLQRKTTQRRGQSWFCSHARMLLESLLIQKMNLIPGWEA